MLFISYNTNRSPYWLIKKLYYDILYNHHVIYAMFLKKLVHPAVLLIKKQINYKLSLEIEVNSSSPPIIGFHIMLQ